MLALHRKGLRLLTIHCVRVLRWRPRIDDTLVCDVGEYLLKLGRVAVQPVDSPASIKRLHESFNPWPAVLQDGFCFLAKALQVLCR